MDKNRTFSDCHFRPDRAIFQEKIKIFAEKVSELRELEGGGRISGEQSAIEIKQFWKELKEKQQEEKDREDPRLEE